MDLGWILGGSWDRKSIENLSKIYRTSIEHLSKIYRTSIEHILNLGPFWDRKSGQLKDRKSGSGGCQGQNPETCPSNEREARYKRYKPEAAFYKPVHGEKTASLERHSLSLASGLRPLATQLF